MKSKSMSFWGGKPLWTGYRLVKSRGKGGFGQVWEVESAAGAKAALKFIKCADHYVVTEELRNIQRIRQLSHPNLIRIDKVWAERGYVAINMELAEGSLNDLLLLSLNDFHAPLPAALVCDYLGQAARGIDFLNARIHSFAGSQMGVQHADIKPGNLLLFGDVIKLCDFGLSRVMDADVVSHRRAGTIAYAAPEVLRGQLSRWTDQYSLAVTYIELRTGKLPFPHIPSRFERTSTRPDPDLSLLPAVERKILARALSATPHDRWPNCATLMAELTAVQNPHPGSAGS